MPVSESRKKANTKWNASRDNITIRLEKETGAAIRSAAAENNMNVTQYIMHCVECVESEKAIDCINPALLAGIKWHIKETGETLGEFLDRAVKDEMAADEAQWDAVKK